MSWRKIVAAVLLLATSKNAVAAAAVSVTAGLTASHLGRDPVPWLIGAAAVTVVYAYWRPADKPKALANGVISVFLGGIGAPLAGAQFVKWEWLEPAPINDWALAFVLGACWPWLVPIALKFIERRAERAGNGQ